MQKFNNLSDLLEVFHPGMRGQRTRAQGGSISEKGLDEIGDRPVTEFIPVHGYAADADDEGNPARYFLVSAPEIGGRLGAIPFADMPGELAPLVRPVFAERHGIGFYLDRDVEDSDLPPVSEAVVICGPARDPKTGKTVRAEDGSPVYCGWTWFPNKGETMTGTFTTGEGEHLKVTACPANEIAVKLYRPAPPKGE